MKTQVMKKAGIWSFRTLLLGGLGYAVLSLMVTTAVRASACVCNAEQYDDANEFCGAKGLGQVLGYSCSPTESFVFFTCTREPNIGWELACD